MVGYDGVAPAQSSVWRRDWCSPKLARVLRRRIVPGLVAATLLGSCGGLPATADSIIAEVADQAMLSKEAATCIYEKVVDQLGTEVGEKTLLGDTNFSELHGKGGRIVGQAYEECSGKDLGYTPEG